MDEIKKFLLKGEERIVSSIKPISITQKTGIISTNIVATNTRKSQYKLDLYLTNFRIIQLLKSGSNMMYQEIPLEHVTGIKFDYIKKIPIFGLILSVFLMIIGTYSALSLSSSYYYGDPVIGILGIFFVIIGVVLLIVFLNKYKKGKLGILSYSDQPSSIYSIKGKNNIKEALVFIKSINYYKKNLEKKKIELMQTQSSLFKKILSSLNYLIEIQKKSTIHSTDALPEQNQVSPTSESAGYNSLGNNLTGIQQYGGYSAGSDPMSSIKKSEMEEIDESIDILLEGGNNHEISSGLNSTSSNGGSYGEPLSEASSEPINETSSEPINEAFDEPLTEASDDVLEEPLNDFSKEPLSDNLSDLINEPSSKPSDSPSSKPSSKPSKESTKDLFNEEDDFSFDDEDFWEEN